jgi:hypothetical protein
MKGPRARKSDALGKRPRATAADQGQPRPSDDRVAARAYELFLQRGGEHGRDREDWLLAERELEALVRP